MSLQGRRMKFLKLFCRENTVSLKNMSHYNRRSVVQMLRTIQQVIENPSIECRRQVAISNPRNHSAHISGSCIRAKLRCNHKITFILQKIGITTITRRKFEPYGISNPLPGIFGTIMQLRTIAAFLQITRLKLVN